jgi:uncharacterized NAD(P)/FAD-binding protein YdhS
MNLHLITAADCDAAATEPDLDTAVRQIMDKAGIEDGDVAGIYFDGDLTDDTTSIRDSWPSLQLDERVAYLLAWLDLETMHQAQVKAGR